MMIYETDTDRTLIYDGTGWIIMSEPSQAFTPPVANLTAGDGVWTAHYHRSDGWIDIEAHFQFGTTSAIAGDLILGLPIASATVTPDLWTVSFVDTSAGQTFVGQAETTGAFNSVFLRAIATGTGFAIGGALGPAAPFAWAPTDRIVIAGRYRMTTRYS
jgi:hypothetical protein